MTAALTAVSWVVQTADRKVGSMVGSKAVTTGALLVGTLERKLAGMKVVSSADVRAETMAVKSGANMAVTTAGRLADLRADTKAHWWAGSWADMMVDQMAD